ncbi:nitrogen regulatory protein PII [Halobacteroides halobius DSM 5150]|uniref:Nitrogen regulatory protein PII n=1 Tax=Halobacteroides halobius (strain ATCC 35273 / DSM 5150 / MD-1) TaxID=748449 RepID=L0K8X1_HALHC|nr:P-II family nitrogen regulator [Halobacteroides halobius]AGB40784.1 nitrogen regulatory protein PII [Halobacteroides halobius DSM 5150]
MKKVECIIRPTKLEELIVAVEELGINGMNITQIAGYGKQRGKKDVYRGVEYEVKLKEKLKVEMVIAKDKVDDLIDVIIETTRTDEVGDGKIFVYSIEETVRIRTGERGQKAI